MDGRAGTRQTGEMLRMPYISNYTRADLERMRAQEVKDLNANITGSTVDVTKPAAIQSILDYQAANPLEQVGRPADRESMHTVIAANTPILFEIDLPGLHPTPVGWPEELIYSMMEVLAKYREQISGLNGETFRRDDFLSPSINSDFRFDPDAEVELSWYDEAEQRQRRYGLSYNKMIGVLNLSAEEDRAGYYTSERMNTAARTAYALTTIADSMGAIPGDERANFELYTELLGIMNSLPQGNPNARTFARYEEIYNLLNASGWLESVNYLAQTGAEKALFIAGDDNIVNKRNRLRFCQLVIEGYWTDFFQYAMQSGQGMVSLNVDTSNGLSSMFILREILKQGRTKYNYVASADDTAFIYHVLVWCLDNCLGARRQTSEERRSIQDLFRGVMNNLRERREQDVANVVNQAFAGANLDAVQEALLIDELLRGLGN